MQELYVQSTSGREFFVSSTLLTASHPLQSRFIVKLAHDETTWHLIWHTNELKWVSALITGNAPNLTDTEATDIGEGIVAFFR